jgi:major membrane immunogen (membrane-anchored lipoprotein)
MAAIFVPAAPGMAYEPSLVRLDHALANATRAMQQLAGQPGVPALRAYADGSVAGAVLSMAEFVSGTGPAPNQVERTNHE